jgi:cytochrome c biogenesis protein CcmG/thiol:disulfide interchange protein DsbE
MKSPRLIATTALALAFLLHSSGLSAEILKARYRKPAPGFTLADSKRAPITLSDLKGKVVLLDFWATWSAGCKIEMPWFVEFDTKYRHNGLAAVGVSMDDEGWAIVAPYLDVHAISYPIVLGDSEVADRFGVVALPVTLLIDRNGKVAAKHYGVVDKAGLENEIRKLLKERQKAPKR